MQIGMWAGLILMFMSIVTPNMLRSVPPVGLLLRIGIPNNKFARTYGQGRQSWRSAWGKGSN